MPDLHLEATRFLTFLNTPRCFCIIFSQIAINGEHLNGWTSFCHTVLPNLRCHLWTTWCHYYVPQANSLVQETPKLLRQQTERQQQMAVTLLSYLLRLTVM